jgi:hypothetical protein
VFRIPFVLAFVTAALLHPAVVAPAAGSIPLFNRKPKTDAARVRSLAETLKADPDEKKRAAAARELGAADPRANPDVVPALAAALKRDSSALVRAEAAQSIGRLDLVFPLAGLALEEAAEADPSPTVRGAAKQSLWEYHLHGYRSAKGADGIAGQTAEPPIASPSAPRPAVALVPAPPVPVETVTPGLPAAPPTAAPPLPPVAPQPGPRLLPNFLPGPRTAVRTLVNPAPPPILNLTAEPPLAKPTPQAVRPSAPQSVEPPILRVTPEPVYTPTLPPFVPNLPPIVTGPGAQE